MTVRTGSAFMRRALELAHKGWGQTAPNPMVGAVVVTDGVVVGEGYHARFGEAHAEVMALRAAGSRAQGATLYVALEPCAHHGKTPPCTEAIIAAGVSRVVAAIQDPSPQAAGGAARLRDAGIDVVFGDGERAARELNAPFLHVNTNPLRPFVTLKLAVSLDGAIAGADRRRGWLTGPRARREVHRLRAGHDAIAVGIGTVLADDPQLTVRHGKPPRVPPRRVVFDTTLRTPVDSVLVRTAGVVPLSIIARTAEVGRSLALEAAGVEILVAESVTAALAQLAGRGVQSLLVEGGARLAGALLRASAVDRLIIFQAPVILGQGALNAFAFAPPAELDRLERVAVLERRALDEDVMTVYSLRAP